jgi:RNA polymerase sigma-70 factor (ECF subfamily)
MKTEMTPELELLKRASLFEQQALAEVYDAHSPGLYRYAMRRLGDAYLAEECVAETFHRFLQALRDGRGPKDFLQAYLYRMVHNWITDHYRRSVSHSVELAEELPDEQANPQKDVEQRRRADRLRAALQQLTADQQQVITLKFLEGWENEQIARTLKKPVGAVKSLQHRALAALQRILQDEELI